MSSLSLDTLSPPVEFEIVNEIKSIYDFKFKQAEWKTDYKDPLRFSEQRYIEVYSLFNEIAAQDSVSDIIISPYLPVLIKIKRRGLIAITKRPLDMREAEEVLKIITANPNTLSLVRSGECVSGLALMLENQVVDLFSAKEYTEFKHERKTRYRYEVVGSSSIESDMGFSIVLRPLPPEPKSYDELNIPLEFIESCLVKDGIVIIGGATGEGKTTTLAAVIRYVLEHDTIIKGNIITHEDPVEISYDTIRSNHSWVTQSAMGHHIKSFDKANRAAMRRSPDLVLVGELRDGETVEAAVEIALTGHPAFATTHANCVAAIFPRLLSRFPKEVQAEKCFDLVDTCRLLASQKLIWRTDGKIMAVRESLPFTPELRQYLGKFTDDPPTVIRKIAGIMEHGLFGVKSYRAQGEQLLADGIISEETLRHLVDASQGIDEEILSILDSL